MRTCRLSLMPLGFGAKSRTTAVLLICKLNSVKQIWRKRVGVEPTFEAREGPERQL
jgi:hypothetical protein